MSRLFRALEATVPGPGILFFSRWILPFAQTKLIYPEDQNSGTSLGALIALVSSIVIRAVLLNASRLVLQIALIICFVATLALMAGCLYFWSLLGAALPPDVVGATKDKWFVTFVAAMAVLCVTITLSSMLYPSSYRTVVIVAITVLALIGIAFAAYFFFGR